MNSATNQSEGNSNGFIPKGVNYSDHRLSSLMEHSTKMTP